MMSAKIKYVMDVKGIAAKEVAEKLGVSGSYFYAKLKKDNWTEKQLQQISEILGVTLIMGFEIRDKEII